MKSSSSSSRAARSSGSVTLRRSFRSSAGDSSQAVSLGASTGGRNGESTHGVEVASAVGEHPCPLWARDAQHAHSTHGLGLLGLVSHVEREAARPGLRVFERVHVARLEASGDARGEALGAWPLRVVLEIEGRARAEAALRIGEAGDAQGSEDDGQGREPAHRKRRHLLGVVGLEQGNAGDGQALRARVQRLAQDGVVRALAEERAPVGRQCPRVEHDQFARGQVHLQGRRFRAGIGEARGLMETRLHHGGAAGPRERAEQQRREGW